MAYDKLKSTYGVSYGGENYTKWTQRPIQYSELSQRETKIYDLDYWTGVPQTDWTLDRKSNNVSREDCNSILGGTVWSTLAETVYMSLKTFVPFKTYTASFVGPDNTLIETVSYKAKVDKISAPFDIGDLYNYYRIIENSTHLGKVGLTDIETGRKYFAFNNYVYSYNEYYNAYHPVNILRNVTFLIDDIIDIRPKITYKNPDESIYRVDRYFEGETIIEPSYEVTQRDKYFDGWTNIPNDKKMPAYDIVSYPILRQAVHITYLLNVEEITDRL